MVNSIDEALAAAGDVEEVMIGGGAGLYEQMLPKADRLYLTKINEVFEGDVYFPAFEIGEWREILHEVNQPDDLNPHQYCFIVLERKCDDVPQ